MITLTNIHKTFGKQEVLKGIDLTVEQGRCRSDPWTEWIR